MSSFIMIKVTIISLTFFYFLRRNMTKIQSTYENLSKWKLNCYYSIHSTITEWRIPPKLADPISMYDKNIEQNDKIKQFSTVNLKIKCCDVSGLYPFSSGFLIEASKEKIRLER